jgi:hypothetical protein
MIVSPALDKHLYERTGVWISGVAKRGESLTRDKRRWIPFEEKLIQRNFEGSRDLFQSLVIKPRPKLVQDRTLFFATTPEFAESC